MKLLKGNMLVQFSVVSLIMMTVVGTAILATLTTWFGAYSDLMHLYITSGQVFLDDEINNLRWLIIGMVAAGFLALYCSSVWIIWRGWKTIVNQRAQLRSIGVDQECLLTQSSEEMDLVDQIGQIISTLDIDEVYEKFVKEVKKLVDFDR